MISMDDCRGAASDTHRRVRNSGGGEIPAARTFRTKNRKIYVKPGSLRP